MKGYRIQYFWIYSLLPAGLVKPSLNFELITPEMRISFF